MSDLMETFIKVLFVWCLFEAVSTINVENISTKTPESYPSKWLYTIRAAEPNIYSQLATGYLESEPTDEYLSVFGNYGITFPNSTLKLYITYTAGKQGYRPHVQFGRKIVKPLRDRLGTDTLKTLAG